MRALLVSVLVLVACVPSVVVKTAGDRLGVRGKHLHLVDYDRIGDRDVYTFCRNERTPFGIRRYDGACVTLVCPPGDEARCD